jgi:hypothetical protein
MEPRDVKTLVRTFLRDNPDSKFSEMFYGVAKHGVSATEVDRAIYEMLKNDELTDTGCGVWNLLEERRAS